MKKFRGIAEIRQMTDEELFMEFYSAKLIMWDRSCDIDSLLDQNASEEVLDKELAKLSDAAIITGTLGNEIASRNIIYKYLDWGKEFGK